MRFFCVLAVLFFTLSPSLSKADFVIAVTAGGHDFKFGDQSMIASVVAGHTVNMSVWIYDNDPANRRITGYSLAFDLDTSGSGFSTDFLSQPLGPNLNDPTYLITPDASSGLILGFDSQIPVQLDNPNFDVAVSTSGNGTKTINSSPIKLFDFTFSTKSTTPLGQYNFVFRADATYDSLGDQQAYNAFTFDFGSTAYLALGGKFQITAVPEPSSLALVGLVSVGMCLARRRRASV